jgi:hypothetical protein
VLLMLLLVVVVAVIVVDMASVLCRARAPPSRSRPR